VSGSRQENTPIFAVQNSQIGGGMPDCVPSRKDANKQPESLGTSGKEGDLRQLAGGQARHTGHNGNRAAVSGIDQPKALCHKALSAMDTADTPDTVDFEGVEGKEGNGAPGGGAARDQFALHPAAVILALAYCRKVKASNDERVSTMLHLGTMPPNEQIRCWHTACIEVEIKPWEVLTLPAPSSGLDCTLCKHLLTRQLSPAGGGRRQFHWACGLGYLILETGRATERIWIAPPECKSFERWQPGKQAVVIVG